MSLTVHPQANCSTGRHDAASLTWPVVNEWHSWADFKIENINALLGTLLDTSFEVVDPPPPLKSSHVLRHESQFDFVLIRRNNIIVNEALRVTCSHLGLDYVEWTRGGNDCGEGTFPDWSGALVSESVGERNLIPGDSKFTRNLLQPIVEETTRSQDSDQLPVSSPSNRKTDLARSCLQQVNNEAAVRRARYFYIITNQELLLCRRTQDPLLSSPIAARRTKRVGVSHPDSTPTRPHAIPPSSPPPLPPSLPPSSPSSLPPSSPPSLPPMTRLRQRPATSLYQVGGDPPSSLPTSQVAPVSRRPCMSG